MRSRRLARLVIPAVLCAGCFEAPPPDAPDANSDWELAEIEGFEISLQLPKDRWLIMDDEGARRVSSGARLVAVAPANDAQPGVLYGAVSILKSSGSLADDVSQINATEVRAEILSSTDFEFQGFAANRTEYRGIVAGKLGHYRRILFIRDGYLFVVTAWADANVRDLDLLDEFAAGVRLGGGEITGALPADSIARAAGTTWTIENNVFTGLSSGLRIAPPPGWRFVVGAERGLLPVTDSEVVLHHPELGIYLHFTGRAHGGDAGWAQRYFEDLALSSWGEPSELEASELAGAPLQRRFFTADGRRVLAGLAIDGDYVTVLDGWYLPDRHDAAIAEIDVVTRAAKRLTPQQAQLARSELLERPDPQRVALGRASWNGKTFRNFKDGVRWDRPTGLFEVFLPQVSTRGGVDRLLAILVETTLGTKVEIKVVGRPGKDRPAMLHGQALADFNDAATVTYPSGALGSLAMHEGFRHAVATLETERSIIQLHASGPPALFTEDLADAFVGGLAPLTEEDVRVDGAEVVDELMRLSVSAPPGEWETVTPTTLSGAPLARTGGWTREGGFAAFIVSMGRIGEADEPTVRKYLAGGVAAQLQGRFDLDELEVGSATIDGRRSITFTGPDEYCEFVTDGWQVVFLVGIGLQPDEIAAWRKTVRFLD